MKKVCVFTATRAEYGLLYWLLKELEDCNDLDLNLIVSGTHLSHEYGYTLDNIVADGFKPSAIFPTLLSSDSPVAVSKTMALLSIDLASYFESNKPDIFVVLGDRYEILAAVQPAVISKIPIAHIHGGETTEGAIDEGIRHAVTKLSSLHFTSTNVYRNRVIQMGEQPETVINCGALGLEAIAKFDMYSTDHLSKILGTDLSSPYFVVAYHPETLAEEENLQELLNVLASFPDYQKILIYPNADMKSREIIKALDTFAENYADNVSLVQSLEHKVYLSLLKHSALLIGNSSSGIIEAPTLRIPIVNIGLRQAGRIRSEVIIDSDLEFYKLVESIKAALTKTHMEKVKQSINPYDTKEPSVKIISEIKKFLEAGKKNRKFYDLGKQV